MSTDKQAEATGTHFEVPEYSVAEKEDYLTLPLNPREIQFLAALFDACENSSHSIITSVELVEELKKRKIACSRPSIDRYGRTLSKYGVFDGAFRKYGHKGLKRRLWRLRDYSSAKEAIDKQIETSAKKKSNPIARSQKIRESNTQYLKSLEGATPRSENFFFGILDRCMPRSSWEDVPDNFMVTQLTFQNELITIETSTQTNGDRLLTWSDKPVMRALLTQIAGLIEARLAEVGGEVNQLENAFPIDTVEIADLMELDHPSNTKNQRRIYNAIRAMESTRFDVKVDDVQNSKFMKFFDLDESSHFLSEAHFRLLSHIDIYDDMSQREVPRHLVVSLGAHLWYRIKNNPTTKAIFRAHREMLSHRVSGIMQVVYDYLRPVIFKTPGKKKERKINKPLQHFARTLVPTMDYSAFKEKFIKGLKDHDAGPFVDWKEESGEPVTVKFCGYYITLFRLLDPDPEYKTRDNLIIQVERDKWDPIIGDDNKKSTSVPASLTGKRFGTYL